MKEFLKYLKMIPVIIYPYIYVVILAVFLMFMNVLPLDYNGTARRTHENPGRGLFYDSIRYVGYYSTLGERILGRIQHSLRLIEIQILYRYADVFEYFVQSLAEVSESNSTVVREVLLDQYVTIETSHFGDSENTDTTEGSGSYGKMSPGTISPSRVPWVTSSGRVLAMIIWYFMLQEVSFLELVLPQWNPMKVSLWV